MNPTKKTIEVTIHKIVYTLAFDFDAIAEAEEVVGRPLITGLRTKDISTPTVNLVRAMFYASAKGNHPELEYATAKALITRENLADVWVKVLEAWFQSSAEPEEASEEVNPTQGQS